MEPASTRPSILERLSALLSPEPEDRASFLEVLHAAHERKLFDTDALGIIEGALEVADMGGRPAEADAAQPQKLKEYLSHHLLPVVIADGQG